jgi:hypothetical protein
MIKPKIKNIKKKKYSVNDMTFIHHTLERCKECNGFDFIKIIKTIDDNDVEKCKCRRCGREYLCEWWSLKEDDSGIIVNEQPNEQSEERLESTINDCDDGCKIE